MICEEAKSLIKRFEGLRTLAYKCPAGKKTIGYGRTKNVKMGDSITFDQADQFLSEDLLEFEAAVDRLVTVPITENQRGALVSFAFNVGVHNLAGSTLLRLLNESKYDEAAEQFIRWNKVKMVELRGLTLRRQAEKALFLQ